MANITNADGQIDSAHGSIGRLYSLLNPESDRSEDVIAFAILALAESQLAIARALTERNDIEDGRD